MEKPPNPRPRYFVSAVTPEFHALRGKVANVLTFLGCDPDHMDIWGTEDGDLRAMLKRKIDACDGLVQIVGRAYGAEPPAVDPAWGRVSYTQFEFLYARAQGKKTWVLIAGEHCAREKPIEELDLPKVPDYPDPAAYQAERRQLQNAYLAAIAQDGHVRNRFDSTTELENAVLRLRNDSEELRQEFRDWQKRIVESQQKIEAGQHRLLIASVAGIVLLCLLGGGTAWWLQRGNTTTSAKIQAAVEDLDTQKALFHSRADKQYTAGKKEIEKLADPDEREKQMGKLKAEYERALQEIERLVETLRTGYRKGEINEITKEFQKILNDQNSKGGIDRALAYLSRKEDELLAQTRRQLHERDEAESNARATLRTFLVAAQSAAIEKRPDEAAKLYEKIFQTDPDWPEALIAAGWFWDARAIFELTEGSFAKSVEAIETASKFADRKKPQSDSAEEWDRLEGAVQSVFGEILMMRGQRGDANNAGIAFERCLRVLDGLLAANPQSAQASRDVSVSLNKLAGFYLQRGKSGDAELALADYERGLKLREDLLAANSQSAEASRDVSISLHNLADFYLQRGKSGDADLALAYYERDLKISEDLLAANPQNAQASRDVSVSLNKLADFYLQRGKSGDADLALAYYERGLKVLDGLLAANPQSAQASRDVSVSLQNLADFYLQRGKSGDAELALAYYERDLKISEDLLAANPQSAESSRDVSVSLNKLAGFYLQRGKSGDAELALADYERGLKLREDLLAANSQSAEASRDVSVSLNNLADFYLQRGKSGDADLALAYYERDLKISEDLLAANPQNAQASRDVSVSLNKLADFYLQRGKSGDADLALAYYERGLKVLDGLLAANPQSAQASRDVSVSLNKLAGFYLQRGKSGDADLALAYYERDLKISEDLLAANPQNAQASRDVSVSLNKLADFYLQRGKSGDADLALAYYERGLKVLDGLLAANPQSAQASRDVSVSLNKLAGFYLQRGKSGDAELALADYERSLKVLDGLLTANPQSAESSRDVSVSLNKLADFYLQRGKSGDAELALADYERGLKLREDLLAANPQNAQASRDVSVSLERLADFYLQRGKSGDAELALAYYERGLKLREDLLAANSQSAEASRDVSVSLNNLADFYLQRGKSGDADLALAYYERDLKISEDLLAANPQNAQASRDVSVSLNKLADFYLQRGKSGDADLALAYYERGLKVLDGLLAANPQSAQASRDVSVSLNKLAGFYLQRGKSGDAELALADYERSLKVLDGLLTANPQSAESSRDVSVSLNKLADFYLQRGKSGDAELALADYERGLKLREDLLAANSQSAEASRDVSVSLNKLADFYLQRGKSGDADLALAYYERDLKISEDLLAANPQNAQASRDVSVSLNKLADFYLQRGKSGDADLALAYYERGLKVLDGLLAANPQSAQASRDVSVSLNKLAGFYLQRGKSGDAELALADYERSLKVLDGLLTANPQSAESSRDVSVSLNKLADFYLQRGKSGDAELALAYYERGLKLREDLLAANPQNAQASRDVSVSLERLADFYLQRGKSGDAELALAYYERGLKLREDLLAANPQNAQASRDVSVSLNKLADFYLQRGKSGDADLALAYYERDLKISEDLLAANPQNAQASRDVSVSLNKLADFYLQRGKSGDADLALAYYERGLKVLDGLLAANPQSAQASRDVSVSLNKLAGFYLQRGKSGDAELALADYERSLKLREDLLAANPQSASAIRDVVVSHITMAKLYLKTHKAAAASDHLRECRRILKKAIEAGFEFDAPIKDLYAALQKALPNKK